mgnify:CR=1 FL=1
MKKHGFRWLSFCMAIFMVLSMAACGGGGETDTSSGESGQPVASAAGQGENTGRGGKRVGRGERLCVRSIHSYCAFGGGLRKAGRATRALRRNRPGRRRLKGCRPPKAEILALYTTVMNKAKAGKPGFKKVEYQEITKKEFDSNAVNWVLDQAGNYMTSPEKANANPAINQKGGDMTWFPVYNGSAGCLIAQGDADKAIQSASCTKLDNGNYNSIIN